MQKKKGVTLLILVISIIILATLTTVVVITGGDIYSSATKTKFGAEINQIEILVKNYEKRNSGVDFTPVIIDITSYNSFEREQFAGENIVEGKISMYVVDLERIDAEQVAYGLGKDGANDRYVYSTVTGRVYYEKGLEIGQYIYYRMDE